MPARLYALRVTYMMAGPSDSMECRIQKAHTALDMEALYPSLAPLPLSVIGNATRHKEKAYGRVLKTRVSEVCRQAVLRGSPRLTDGSPPQGRRAAFVNYLYDDLTRNLFTPAPYLRSFSANSAYYLFRIRTFARKISRLQTQLKPVCYRNSHKVPGALALACAANYAIESCGSHSCALDAKLSITAPNNARPRRGPNTRKSASWPARRRAAQHSQATAEQISARWQHSCRPSAATKLLRVSECNSVPKSMTGPEC